MAGGKGKSTGGKAGPKEVAGKSQKSHSAKAGLQVSILRLDGWYGIKCAIDRNLLHRTRVMNGKRNRAPRPTNASAMLARLFIYL